MNRNDNKVVAGVPCVSAMLSHKALKAICCLLLKLYITAELPALSPDVEESVTQALTQFVLCLFYTLLWIMETRDCTVVH